MNIPNNFIFVSSLNNRLYYHRENHFTKKVPQSFENNKCILYHENSFDKKKYNESINLDEIKHLENLILKDLFEDSTWLENFLIESPFKDCFSSTNYFLKNSPFWFRKVVSICNAINDLKIGDVMVWADCDSYMTKELPDVFYDYLKNHDWLVIFRKNDWIESGFQFININEKTKDFAKYYLNYYLSGEVFKKEPEWADNWVLDSCFKTYNGGIKTGGLTKIFNCPIDINDYIFHSKQPLAEVRSKYKL
jgi:hypothetical protein